MAPGFNGRRKHLFFRAIIRLHVWFWEWFCSLQIFDAIPLPFFSAAAELRTYALAHWKDALCSNLIPLPFQRRAQYILAAWLCHVPSKNGSRRLNLQWSLEPFPKPLPITEKKMPTRSYFSFEYLVLRLRLYRWGGEIYFFSVMIWIISSSSVSNQILSQERHLSTGMMYW